jgi:serine/threonine protein phosphatase 1
MVIKKWIIPDLHGCVKTLKHLVEEKIRLQKSDIIYFLGDYIDRGPNSKGVLDYVMSLDVQGFNVKPLKGNHEEYFLIALEKEANLKKKYFFFDEKNRLLAEWIEHGGRDTLASFGVTKINQISEKYREWIGKLENYYIEEKYVIVHAGLNVSLKDPFEDIHSMLWTRSFEVNPEKIGNRKVVHGHVPVSLDFIRTCIANKDLNYLPLDNGCYLPNRKGMGNLLAFEINSSELLVQPNIE